MTKARKITVERASNRIVSSELLGWMKFRFSDAWLHPRKQDGNEDQQDDEEDFPALRRIGMHGF